MSEVSSLFAPNSSVRLHLGPSEYTNAYLTTEICADSKGRAFVNASDDHPLYGERSASVLSTRVLHLYPDDCVTKFIDHNGGDIVSEDTVPHSVAFKELPETLRSATRDWSRVRRLRVDELRDALQPPFHREPSRAIADAMQRWNSAIDSCAAYAQDIDAEIQASARQIGSNCKIRRAIDRRRELIKSYRREAMDIHVNTIKALMAECERLVKCSKEPNQKEARAIKRTLDEAARQRSSIELADKRRLDEFKLLFSHVASRLRVALGDTWQEKWVSSSFPTTSRDAERAVRHMVSRARAAVESANLKCERDATTPHDTSAHDSSIAEKVSTYDAQIVSVLRQLRRSSDTALEPDRLDASMVEAKQLQTTAMSMLGRATKGLRRHLSDDDHDLVAQLSSLERSLQKESRESRHALHTIASNVDKMEAELARVKNRCVFINLQEFDRVTRNLEAKDARLVRELASAVRTERDLSAAISDMLEQLDINARERESREMRHRASALRVYMAHSEIADSVQHLHDMRSSLSALSL